VFCCSCGFNRVRSGPNYARISALIAVTVAVESLTRSPTNPGALWDIWFELRLGTSRSRCDADLSFPIRAKLPRTPYMANVRVSEYGQCTSMPTIQTEQTGGLRRPWRQTKSSGNRSEADGSSLSFQFGKRVRRRNSAQSFS
jgi:hypothetical protein